ncbi:MAG: cobalt-zinc-cadmium efflux system protein [Bacteroidales bacterium]|nr:cobalt-zinc-cadmium efflux system protein [Bacteroidales bacterium]MDN5328676.1 cobalt-zinc-cadmium efflux system protein [Bacteroidales bacterium]
MAGTIGVNLGIAIVEIVGGIISGSLALVSDAIHNLADTLSLIISYIAMRLSRRQNTERHTFGLRRSEILAAFINSSLLIAISGFLILEAVKRWVHPQNINYTLMGWIALIGLIGNLAGMIILHGIHKDSLNIKSAYLHLLGDTISSVAVVGGAILMAWKGWSFIDPLITVFISIYIVREAFIILKNSISILLMSAPPGIKISDIEERLKEVEGISDIHHVHIWRLDDNTIHFEAHMRASENISLKEADEIRKKAENILVDTFGIAHVTLQIEPKGLENGCRSEHLIEPEYQKLK